MMKFKLCTILLPLFLLFSSSSTWADEYADTRQMFEGAGISDFFDSAYGYALFPTVGKGGVIVGGAYGKGRVYEQGNHIGDTEMSQLSIGFQIGGTGFSQVVFFEDKRALAEFTSGSFEFGVKMQAVVLTASAEASGSSAGHSAAASGGKNNASIEQYGYNKGMAIFTITKGGLMFEVSVAGQTFSYQEKQPD